MRAAAAFLLAACFAAAPAWAQEPTITRVTLNSLTRLGGAPLDQELVDESAPACDTSFSASASIVLAETEKVSENGADVYGFAEALATADVTCTDGKLTVVVGLHDAVELNYGGTIDTAFGQASAESAVRLSFECSKPTVLELHLVVDAPATDAAGSVEPEINLYKLVPAAGGGRAVALMSVDEKYEDPAIDTRVFRRNVGPGDYQLAILTRARVVGTGATTTQGQASTSFSGDLTSRKH